MSSLTLNDFEGYFKAIFDTTPFPWQTRLLHQVVAKGEWPSLLDLPTGSGKTATLDIALFHLALDAQNPPEARKAPRRIVMVVDRRTIVDQAFVRAQKIAKAIANAKEGVLYEVQKRLAALTGASRPLAIAQLRGGMPRDDAWAKWPDQALMVVSTVDQVGSRLLFRGYGVSHGMRPVHAGLFGNDTLFLLDEVHLSEPFRQTLASIARYRKWTDGALPSRFGVVELSATPGKKSDFDLHEADYSHPVLGKRLAASKPVLVDEAIKVTGSESARRNTFAEKLVERALPWALPGKALGIIVNRVALARETFERLQKRIGKDLPAATQLFLVTGRMRALDRDLLNQELTPLLGAERRYLQRKTIEAAAGGASESPAAAPLIVVSTQCIEAGADFDFDSLVTECASLDALRQRFGRLNRFGEVSDAEGAILTRADMVGDGAIDPIYGEKLANTYKWLKSLTPCDFGISAMKSALDVLPSSSRDGENKAEDATGSSPFTLEMLLSPKANAPVMLPAHLDLWSQTKPSPAPDPDIALWLHGIGGNQAPEVNVVWRADLDARVLEQALSPSDSTAKDFAVKVVEACPPSSLEALSLPLYAVRAWLEKGDSSDVVDVENDPRSEKERERDEETNSGAHAEKGSPRPALLWGADERRVILPQDGALRAGCTLIVPDKYGGLIPFKTGGKAAGTWAPESVFVIPDLGDEARFQQTRKPILRLHRDVQKNPDWAPTPASMDEAEDPDREDRQAAMEALEAIEGALLGEHWLREASPALMAKNKERPAIVRVEPEGDLFVTEDGSPKKVTGHLVVVGKKRVKFKEAYKTAVTDVTTEGDDGAFTGVEKDLEGHMLGVATLAEKFAQNCGMSDTIVRTLRDSARFHDIGKADPRFQQLLRADGRKPRPEEKLLAKSAILPTDQRGRKRAEARSTYPRGGRHELLSVALLESAKDLWTDSVDAELLLHLVGAHHGFCRPFAPVVDDREPQIVEYKFDKGTLHANTDHKLERLDSGVAERFWRLTERYGWFGLSWLEALLRLADHRQSEAEQLAEERKAEENG